MKRAAGQVRLAVEPCECREVPAFLGPVTSAGGGINLAVADVNQDGRSDLAVIRRTDNTVSVRVSNGDGTFTQSDVLRGGKGDLYILSISDRNGDGWLDILATGTGHLASVTPGDYFDFYTGTVYTTVWLGRGDGTFGKATMGSHATETVIGAWPPYGIYTPTVAGADFNRDGLLADSASVIGGLGTINVRLRNPDGTLQPSPGLPYAAGPNPGAVVAGDFNGDGWTDLVVVNDLRSNSPALSVLFNDRIW